MYIVLDVDNCLLHFKQEMYPSSGQSLEDILFSGNDITSRQRYASAIIPLVGASVKVEGFLRPHIRDFLKYLTENFNVAVWSAGQPQYVNECVKILFDGLKQPIVTMTIDNVEMNGNSYSKPLSRFFELVPGANATNTLLIDDRKENFLKFPQNGVLIPVYSYKDSNHNMDNNLLKLWAWLETHKHAENVQLLNKSTIFESTNPINVLKREYNPHYKQHRSVKSFPQVVIE